MTLALYMQKDKRWDIKTRGTVTSTKVALTDLSIKVRSEQFSMFVSKLKPTSKSMVLDVGATSDEILKDSNMFEKLYQFPEKLIVDTIEDEKKLKKIYPLVKKVVKIQPHTKLPFKDKTFDIVVPWATLEHTGNYINQNLFLNELLRVGKKVFVTTPYRGALYEPHSGLPLLHWLPLPIFRLICKIVGKSFWSDESHLNPLWVNDIEKMRLHRKVKIQIFKTFNFLPSHIIITG